MSGGHGRNDRHEPYEPQAAAQRQRERDALDELLAGLDRVNGPADPDVVAAKTAQLTGPTPGAPAPD